MKKFGRRTTDSDTYHHIHHKCQIDSKQAALPWLMCSSFALLFIYFYFALLRVK